jgi:hypothetical protein
MLEEGLIQESDERPDPHLDDARRRYYHEADDRTLAVASRSVNDVACHGHPHFPIPVVVSHHSSALARQHSREPIAACPHNGEQAEQEHARKRRRSADAKRCVAMAPIIVDARTSAHDALSIGGRSVAGAA